MFSEKAKVNADACRFCWMCRHVCPVGLVTGKEGNNARAKGLLISMHERGIFLNADAMKLMYECCLCKACTNDCATGYDPSIFILEARTQAVVDGMVPANVQEVIERVETGSIYKEEEDAALLEKIAKLPAKADMVLFLGENARRKSSAIAKAYLDLLEKAGIHYTVLKEEPSSGAQYCELVGKVDEVRTMAQSCLNALSETGAKTIVVLDPTDCAFFKHFCAEWGILPEANVITATAYAEKLIESGKLTPRNLGIRVTFHDPCRLARDLEETASARNILASMGVDVGELFLNKKLTKCCGGALLGETYPEIADKTIANRWADVETARETFLITACPCCYSMMQKEIPEGTKLEDIFVLLNSAC